MKNYILIAFILCSGGVFAQRVGIANAKLNILYLGLPNPLIITAENTSCGSLVVSTDNGKIERNEKCNFVIYPDSPGKAIISVRKKTLFGSKVIGREIFRIHNIPDPTPIVGGKSGGKISKNVLAAQRGVATSLPNFDIDIRLPVKRFKTVILRDAVAIYSKAVQDGPLFPEEMTQYFKTLKPSDVVIFYDIHYLRPDKVVRPLHPIELTIE